MRGARWFSWRLFFRATEILLLLLGGALLVDGLDKLIGLEALPALADPLWDAGFLLDDSGRVGGLLAAFTGWRAQPAVTQLPGAGAVVGAGLRPGVAGKAGRGAAMSACWSRAAGRRSV